jgi:hypothetical protein
MTMTRATMLVGSFAWSFALLLGLACDVPECIEGPSNLTPEATAVCESPSSPLESEIVSASAQWRDDGGLVLSWSSWGLECGVVAGDVDFVDECDRTGWIITTEIPPELAVPGVLVLAEHPEVVSMLTVMKGGDGGGGLSEGPYAGAIELEVVGDACVSGNLLGFGTGSPDPTLGGPQLDGGFVAPSC